MSEKDTCRFEYVGEDHESIVLPADDREDQPPVGVAKCNKCGFEIFLTNDLFYDAECEDGDGNQVVEPSFKFCPGCGRKVE